MLMIETQSMVSYLISFNTLLCTFSSILIITSRVGLVEAISEPTLVDNYCTSSHHYTPENPFGENVDLLLSSLSSNASSSTNTNGFYNTTIGQGRNQVYGSYLCRGDVAHNTCRICVETAVEEIKQRCAPNQYAILWYEECFIRYGFRNPTFVGNDPQAYKSESRHISDPEIFNQTLSNLMDNLAKRAISNSASSSSSAILYFATGEANSTKFQQIYGLLQCTRDHSPSDCNSCLRNAVDQISLRFNESSSGLGAYYLNCVARYSDRLFYELNSSASATPRLNEGSSLRTTFITATPVVIMVMLVSVLLLYVKRRRRRNRKSKECVLNEIISGDTLQFDFSTIRDATDNFSDANKLGVGGFGTVYKGRLSNGQEVAVKRHSINSTQGELEFKNEVALVAELQHRNLVRLLGFCLKGKLLIYEFVPNGSLDYTLFDPIKRADLDWEKRYNIIEGIARGLLYLHQDSPFKIIHRDLKPSNILLDANMNPKISDFGLARLVGMEQSREKTKRIAGTIGYMPPEYAIKGRFSVKSDVYSFGVILLEILSGKRVNRFYCGDYSQNLLGYAWRLWLEDRGLEFIDPMLRDSCPTPDVLSCLLVGLLCVQGDVECRPTMLSVIWMLKQTLNVLPQPSEPAISMGRTRLEANWNTLSVNVPKVIHSGFSPR